MNLVHVSFKCSNTSMNVKTMNPKPMNPDYILLNKVRIVNGKFPIKRATGILGYSFEIE